MIEPDKIDWTELVKQVEATEPQEGWGWDGEPAKVVFLGTVFDLMPSGKYHTPFACGNVTEEEAIRDVVWYTEMEYTANKHGLFLTSGSDPCDIMAGKFIEEG